MAPPASGEAPVGGDARPAGSVAVADPEVAALGGGRRGPRGRGRRRDRWKVRRGAGAGFWVATGGVGAAPGNVDHRVERADDGGDRVRGPTIGTDDRIDRADDRDRRSGRRSGLTVSRMGSVIGVTGPTTGPTT